jgi:hypothetical protein
MRITNRIADFAADASILNPWAPSVSLASTFGERARLPREPIWSQRAAHKRASS